MARHWADIREAGVLRGMQFMVWVHKNLGYGVFNVVLVPVMAYYFVRRGEARRASFHYLKRLRRSHPGRSPSGPLWLVSFRHFMAFGRSLLQKYLAWADVPPTVVMEAGEQSHLFDFVDSGQGCLAIGSHFGNLEFSRGISRRHPDLVMNVLLHDKHAAKFARLMEQANAQSRMHLIQVTEFDLALTLMLKEKVERGEWVVMAGDRVPVDASSRVVSARFFGDSANFPVGPMVLANVLRCPVYLLHCYEKGKQHHLGFEKFAEQVSLTGRNKEQAVQAYAQRYAQALEQQVIQAPLQWFNFFDFWGDDARSNDKRDHR